MCGISGFNNNIVTHFNRNSLIKNFNELQIHRGPDYTGTWMNEDFTFFHHRLALIDGSSNANQPFFNENYVLCFNGEIYNFKKLKQVLSSVQFKSSSDTEVLFYYLVNFGIEKTLQDIQGMFAFSFYDIAKKELFLARDRFGIKPLYFYKNGSQFAFASESRTLAKALNLKPDSYKTIMAMNSTAEGSTTYSLFNHVENIQPGSFVKIDTQLNLSEHFYYRLANDVDVHLHNDLKKLSKKQIVDQFDNLMSKSVEEMLVSDFPMGAFVSGGIDSSIITALAKEKISDFSLFTADINGKHSEYEDAKALANHLKLPLFKTDFKPEDFLSYWVQATEYNAAPKVYFTNGIPISRVASLARQYEVKAVICGEGSDELFLGYSKLMAQRYKKALLFPHDLIKKLYKIYPALNNYLFPSNDSNLDAFNIRFANGFKSEMLYEAGNEVYSFISNKERKYYVDSFEMAQKHLHALFHRNDRMGMISSIEVRFPFLHEEVVKFAVNLPLEYKTRWTTKLHNKKHPFITDKWIVREISKKHLPKNLVSKKKNGLPIEGLNGLKFDKSFFKDGYLAEIMHLNNAALEHIIKNENPYFIGKLASVEIFGLLYDYQLSNEEIQSKINQFITLKK